MLLNEKINIKYFYRLIEFVSKLLGGTLPHERYKLISLDEYKAESKEELEVKRFKDAYLYLLNNVNQSLTNEIIDQAYLMLTLEPMNRDKSKIILETYYKNFDETSHYLAALMHLCVLDNVEIRKIEFAFMLSNLIMLKKKRFPLIPYDFMYNSYFRAIKNHNKDKIMAIFSEIESITKPHKYDKALNLDMVIEKLKEIKSVIKNKYDVQKLFLYGSYAKSKITNQSDLDFLVVFNHELINLERSMKREELIHYIEDSLNITVDLLDFTHAMENLDISEMENIISII